MSDIRPIAVPVGEAARMVGLDEVSFRRLLKRGATPAPVLIGSMRRWLVSDLEEWMRKPPRPPAPDAPRFDRRPKSVPLGPGTCHLYRHFDRDGRLLYVGISLSAVARLAAHKKASHWFWQIARIEVTAYATRESALKAERISIQREKPLHNIVHAVREAA